MSQLTAALGNSNVNKIVVAAGTYNLTSDMCSHSGDNGVALCISRDVTIEAAVMGGVVLKAEYAALYSTFAGGRSVIRVTTGATAHLVGLNITGGNAQTGGGLRIEVGGVADMEGCNIYENGASFVRLPFELDPEYHSPLEGVLLTDGVLCMCAGGAAWSHFRTFLEFPPAAPQLGDARFFLAFRGQGSASSARRN